MSAETHEAIQTFVARLVLMKAARGNPPLEEAQLKRMAVELGFTEADWQEAERLVGAQLYRGRRFAGVQRWDEAIADLTNAAALMPGNIQVMLALAEAYVGRWAQLGKNGDRRAAEKLVRRIVEVDPFQDSAYDLLARIREAEAEVEAKKQAERNPLILCCVALTPVVVGIGVLLFH